VSADPGAPHGAGAGWDAGSPAGAAGGQQAPSEEELRNAYEAELSRITTTDMIAQAAISLLNLGARRMGGPPESEQQAGAGEQGGEDGAGAGGRDLEQVRDAIDGVRALMGILERRVSAELGPLRDALSQLQMAYARAVGAGGGAGQAGGSAGGEAPTGGAGGGAAGQAGPGEGAPAPPTGRRPGPAESSGRLWVPGR
jgi:hypothetical protein